MKPDKLDFAVFCIVLLCLAGVAIAAYIDAPSRQPSRVAYLYPASGAPQNVWLADIDASSQPQQLTFSEAGVYDFDFSPDGRWLAYADRSGTGTITLRLLNLQTRRVIDAVDCVALEAYCTSPVFSPDGATLAYQRSEKSGVSYGLSRIWLVDLGSPSYETAPLIADTQVLGHSAIFSADGNTVAFFSGDTTQPGILIYDFLPRAADGVQLRFIPSSNGTMGSISPDGQRIIFPELVRRGNQFFTHLQIADLANKEFAAFTDPQGPIDDANARWSPDGQTIALARRYTDERWTVGYQLYLRQFAAETAELTPVAYDQRYTTAYFRWNAAGDKLITQRLPRLKEDGSSNPGAQPEVWVHDLERGTSRKIVEDAYLPQWAS